MRSASLSIYALLSRFGFPKSYQGKIIFVACMGIYVPLLALTLYLLLDSPIGVWPALRIFTFLLAAALVGTVATLYVVRALLTPVSLASSSLEAYLDDGRVPDLPIGYTDEAGRLMANVQYAIEHLDSTIRSLERRSATDHLTGTLNRREGEVRLTEEAARMRRGGGILTVGMVDINRFKQINDTYGHHAGDACLRQVAEVIRRNIRQSDWLARWGGDEFVVVLYDASPFAPSAVILQRIVKDLKDSPVRLPQGEELRLSVTVGAVRYSGEGDLSDSLAKADEAMYEAKREGRPWVISA